MTSPSAHPATIAVDDTHRVSALTLIPSSARACFVFAHGAGAGMTHPFMEAIAAGLGEAGIATLRFQFPYMEAHARRPDPPALCHATVRAAVAEAARVTHGLPLIAGGRSFGGRMSSQAQAKSSLPGVLGLAFLGFPLHPAKRPSVERGQHLFEVNTPLLFLQGDRDELADLILLQNLVEGLGARATLKLIPNANHAYRVPARTGRSEAQIRGELVQTLHDWIGTVIASS
ncbi:MAG: alpha/beta family hydrolase [Steroidobacteraceae bacterium]